MTRFLLSACAALALSACATATEQQTTAEAAAGERDCFLATQVSGYSVVDDHHVRVRVGANRYYMLAMLWDARDLDWGQRIQIRSNQSWICTGNAMSVRIVGGDPVRDYLVDTVERTTAPQPDTQQGS